VGAAAVVVLLTGKGAKGVEALVMVHQRHLMCSQVVAQSWLDVLTCLYDAGLPCREGLDG
jgi:hypothetical protein